MARVLRHNLTAIVEADSSRREEASREYPHVRICSSLASIVPGDCDVLVEESSIKGRREAYEWALRNQLPVVLEKPLALAPEHLGEFCSGRYTVNFHERSHPVVTTAAEILQRPPQRLLGLTFIRANAVADEKCRHPGRRDAVVGGCMVDKGIHDMANLGVFLGNAEGLSPSAIHVDRSVQGWIGDERQACDLYTDVRFCLSQRGMTLPVRLIASWIGLPEEILEFIATNAPASSCLACPESPVYPPIPSGFHSVRSKLFVADFVSTIGTERLIGSTLEREDIGPYLAHGIGDAVERLPIDLKRSADSLLDPIAAAQHSTPEHIQAILAVHRATLALRDAVARIPPHLLVPLPDDFVV
jgi:hypothetical protein